jgi:hypothetical protein
MKKSIIIGLGIVLLFVISVLVWHHYRPPSDAEIHQTIIGTWRNPKGFGQMTFDSDGSFSSSWKAGSRTNTFEGTWLVKDGELTATVTNRGATTVYDSRSKIIQVDKNILISVEVEHEHQTNRLTR